MSNQGIDDQDADFEAQLASIRTARAAIVAAIGPWTSTRPGASRIGVGWFIACPICGVANALRFRRAASNGHVHAACQTPGCVQWME